MKYPFHDAARKGDIETVMALVAAGADVNAPDHKGNLVLNHAALSGNVDLCRFLLENGANLDATDKEGKTALHWAAMSGENDVLRLLIRCGSNVNRHDHYGSYTALHLAVACSAHNSAIETVDILLAAGADIHACTRWGTTALISAAIRGHQPLVEHLLSCGADVDARSYDGKTPLLTVAKLGIVLNQNGMVTLLLDHGADVSAKDREGCTAMHWAALYERSALAELLLSRGAEINARDRTGKTPFMYACGPPPPSPTIAMVESITDPEKRKKFENHLPKAYEKRAKMVQFWLEHGADAAARDEQGMTALDYALKQGRPEIIQVLEGLGSSD